MWITFLLCAGLAKATSLKLTDLKPNQTYYLVTGESAARAQFEVWLRGPTGWTDHRIGTDQNGRVSEAGFRPTGVVRVGAEVPPDEAMATGEPARRLAADLGGLPGITDVRVFARGSYQAVLVREVVLTNPADGRAFLAEAEFERRGDGLTLAGPVRARRGRLTAERIDGDLLDHRLPAVVEGSLLLPLAEAWYVTEGLSPRHREAYAHLLRALDLHLARNEVERMHRSARRLAAPDDGRAEVFYHLSVRVREGEGESSRAEVSSLLLSQRRVIEGAPTFARFKSELGVVGHARGRGADLNVTLERQPRECRTLPLALEVSDAGELKLAAGTPRGASFPATADRPRLDVTLGPLVRHPLTGAEVCGDLLR